MHTIVDREAYVGSANEQLPVPLPDGREPRGLPIDHTRLDLQAHFLRSGVERCINTGLIAMDDDDVAAVTGDQSPQNPCGEVGA